MKTKQLHLALTTNPHTYSVYGGIYPRDKLPKHISKTRPVAFIANTHKHDQPGEHWVAFYFGKDGRAVYFDSYGEPPRYPEFITFLINNSATYVYNIERIQGFDKTCGIYCLFFLYNMTKRLAANMFQKLTITSWWKNDVWIRQWMRNHFSLDV